MTPDTPTFTSVAALVSEKIEESGKTIEEISYAAGMAQGALEFVANGTMKLPFNSISRLAHAINTDPSHLLRTAMHEYAPEILEAVEVGLASPVLSKNELALLDSFRKIARGRDISSVVVERDGLLELVLLSKSKGEKCA